jgi:hypothetical protein
MSDSKKISKNEDRIRFDQLVRSDSGTMYNMPSPEAESNYLKYVQPMKNMISDRIMYKEYNKRRLSDPDRSTDEIEQEIRSEYPAKKSRLGYTSNEIEAPDNTSYYTDRDKKIAKTELKGERYHGNIMLDSQGNAMKWDGRTPVDVTEEFQANLNPDYEFTRGLASDRFGGKHKKSLKKRKTRKTIKTRKTRKTNKKKRKTKKNRNF